MSATWREHAAPIIADVIKRVGKSDIKALRKALREAYPYGERKYHPYKVWCDEIKRQLSPGVLIPTKRCNPIKAKECDPRQQSLFADG